MSKKRKGFSECSEIKINTADEYICDARDDAFCEDYDYLLYNYDDCPKLKGTEHDATFRRISFRLKKWTVEKVISFFKKFLVV